MTGGRQLHIFPTFAMGGAQRRFAQLANAMPEWDHVIVPLDGQQGAMEALHPSVRFKIGLIKLEKSSGVSLDNIKKLHALMRVSKADILCTYNWGSVEAALANRLGTRLPHIHFEDGFGPEEAGGTIPRRNLFRRLALNGRTVVVVPSHGLKRIARDKWHIPDRRLRYMANGIDLSRFQARPEGTRTEGNLRIGMVGALRREKNIPRLLEAVAGASTRIDLTLVGDGPERGRLEEQAAGLSSPVTFTGNLAEPSSAYQGFDIFMLTSDTEQMPLTVLEAMASALPVIATDVGDIATMVSEENRPFIVPVEETSALSQAIDRLAGDADLMRRIGLANREKAETLYSEEAMLARYRQLFADVTTSSR